MLIRKFMFVAAVTLAGALAVSCSNSSNQKSSDETTDSIAEESVEVPEEAPDAAVITLNDDNLLRPDKAVDQVTLLDFNATWCVPCKKFGPAFESTAAKFSDKAKFYSVDIDVNPETAKAFGVESVPTIIVIKKDGTVDRYVGIGDVLPAEKFEAIVEKAL
jgi:thioredoxin 1